MGTCARCDAVTDEPASDDYQYCDECRATFDRIRRRGVVVTQRDDSYYVSVPKPGSKYEGGFEETPADALARAKFVADDLGVNAMFEHRATGAQWLLDDYLHAHPEVAEAVTERLNRIPDSPGPSLIEQVKDFFR